MGATKVNPEPEDGFCFEIAYAGQLDISESDRLVVYSASSEKGGCMSRSGWDAAVEASDWDVSIETVVSLSFQGEVVR